MKPVNISIIDFDYDLPDDKIAKYPLEQRSGSKLLFYKDGNIGHKQFNDLSNLLSNNTLLVFNNSRVIEARLKFKKDTGAEIEVFLLNPSNNENATKGLDAKGQSSWECMIGNKKRWSENEELTLSKGKCTLVAKWKNRDNDIVQFEYPSNISLQEIIHELGSLPIPPYLNRPTEEIDLIRYQTSFAKFNGSVAAPTAALHFDENIYHEFQQKGITCQYLTLHVGAGTFKPISAENALDHIMHGEYIIYSREFIQSLIVHNGPVVAVGTTSFRSLESLYWFGVGLHEKLLSYFHIDQYFPFIIPNNTLTGKESLTIVLDWMDKNNMQTLEGTSSIYIVPGYKPKMVIGIVTNFHQPQSTLLLLIAALIGDDWKRVYTTALENNYRFLSYGDSSLLLF